jgi:hypothetical protein
VVRVAWFEDMHAEVGAVVKCKCRAENGAPWFFGESAEGEYHVICYVVWKEGFMTSRENCKRRI